jgi:hypothetical protein
MANLALVGCNKKNDETANAPTAPPAGASPASGPNPGGPAPTSSASSPGTAAKSAAGGVSNAGVTAKVKNAINLSSAIDHKKSKINVDTTDTEVKLMGTVAPATGKAAAEKLAKANAGTRKVVDQLTVGAKAP